MQPISKSTFLQYQICPKDTWLRLHRPELVDSFIMTDFELHLLEQGNEVEECARSLFPGASLISSAGDEAIADTKKLMERGVEVIFQGTFLADGFYIKCDVLKRGSAAGIWDLYEIKGTNSKKEGSQDRDHISDLAFQKHVLNLAGISVGRALIVHLNKEYIRKGALNLNALFVMSDSSEQVQKIEKDIVNEMQAAKEFLNKKEEPSEGCGCHLKGRSAHCRSFAYSHPDIPQYSVHDIVRIGTSKKKIKYFMDEKIYEIDDVPNDYELGDAQTLQVQAHKTKRPIIDASAIAEVLKTYNYPLYFFDYETFAPAIPAFDGFGPYKRIPFQFSLHIVRSKGSEPEHVEFLHRERSDPTRAVADLLRSNIDPKGTVIVWYAPFEKGVNQEIGQRLTEFAELTNRVNGQLQDLRDIFSKQLYVHPDFRGSTSIKDVMPVLAPELSYNELVIQDGGTASEQWWKMTAVETATSERDSIADALRAYCKLDSYAMYAIWRAF